MRAPKCPLRRGLVFLVAGCVGLSCALVYVSCFYGRAWWAESPADRAQVARQRHMPTLRKVLAKRGLDSGRIELLLRVFKEERELEVYARPAGGGRYRFLRRYPICAASGGPGPKHYEGDEQVPEGEYAIVVLNPASRFHLSLGLDYPRPQDRARAGARSPGGDIYIHGDCVSVGCLALTDAGIEELYVLVELARRAGQRQVPVFIFPARLTATKYRALARAYPEHADFWRELKRLYQSK